MRSTTSELNWSGTVTYTAGRVVRPSSIDEAAQVVADADRVHGLGTRHSFNDVADTAGTLLDLTGIPTDLVVDTEHRTVTLGAGTRYGDVAADIDRAGFALHNTGSLPHISVGGAVATGTHGSGTTLGSLATAVRAFEVLGPDGSARTIDRTDPAFDGAVLHLGLLGIVTRVTLDVEPAYRMRQDVYGAIPWDTFTANAAEVHATAYSVCAYTVFGDAITEVLVKSRVPEGAEDVPVPETLAGARRLPGTPGDDLSLIHI